MSRAAIISAGLCLGLGALPAHAQGVPTQDNSAIGRAIARVTALAEDLGVQQDKDHTTQNHRPSIFLRHRDCRTLVRHHRCTSLQHSPCIPSDLPGRHIDQTRKASM